MLILSIEWFMGSLVFSRSVKVSDKSKISGIILASTYF